VNAIAYGRMGTTLRGCLFNWSQLCLDGLHRLSKLGEEEQQQETDENNETETNNTEDTDNNQSSSPSLIRNHESRSLDESDRFRSSSAAKNILNKRSLINKNTNNTKRCK